MTKNRTRPDEGYSRRLIGPNLFSSLTGAVLDTDCIENQEILADLWQREALRLLPELGIYSSKIYYKKYSSGLRLSITIPVDITLAGCDIIDELWSSACDVYMGGINISADKFKEKFSVLIEKQENLIYREVYKLSKEKGFNVFYNEKTDVISIGSGKFVYKVLSKDCVIKKIPWNDIKEIPSALVTGTNGKTTTVRLVNGLCLLSGLNTGYCSTDWVMINDEIISKGDYSGPAGNQFVLTNDTLDVAVLETARGGLLKRGLSSTNLTIATVTNVSADHLGEDGIETVADLAEAKAIVYKTVEKNGIAIFNLDDPFIKEFSKTYTGKKVYISQKLSQQEREKYLADCEYFIAVENYNFIYQDKVEKVIILAIKDAPITVNGFAKHNIENSLQAIALCYSLGLNFKQIKDSLSKYKNNENDNPGRANIFKYKNSTIIVDFAHNAAGFKAILSTAEAYTKQVDVLMIGHTGDRINLIDEISQEIIPFNPKEILIKDLKGHLRGAKLGEVTETSIKSLKKYNYKGKISTAEDEMEAVHDVLSKVKENGVYILCCHVNIPKVLARLSSIGVVAC